MVLNLFDSKALHWSKQYSEVPPPFYLQQLEVLKK